MMKILSVGCFMKKITGIVLGLTLVFSSAHAEILAAWKFPTGNTPMLAPSNGPEIPVILSVVNTDTWLVSLVDMRPDTDPFSSCGMEKTPKKIDIPPVSVNGKYLKFVSVCLSGYGILQPKTDAGKKYFNETALSGNPVTVALNESLTLRYPKSDIKAMKQKVAELKGAM